jgi:hypothetical protein
VPSLERNHFYRWPYFRFPVPFNASHVFLWLHACSQTRHIASTNHYYIIRFSLGRFMKFKDELKIITNETWCFLQFILSYHSAEDSKSLPARIWNRYWVHVSKRQVWPAGEVPFRDIARFSLHCNSRPLRHYRHQTYSIACCLNELTEYVTVCDARKSLVSWFLEIGCFNKQELDWGNSFCICKETTTAELHWRRTLTHSNISETTESEPFDDDQRFVGIRTV